MNNKHWIICAVILAVGIAFAGGAIGGAIGGNIRHYADKDRYVTVKGLSTREVMADHAIWPLSFNVEGNDLPELYQELGRLQRVIEAFLVEQGFSAEDMTRGNVNVSDNWNNYYTSRRPEYKYTLSTKLIISTDNVELVKNSQGCQSQLLAKGIILNSEQWQLEYQYNGLSELKPSMIEEATKNARAVAQKFADDAACGLGSIRNAYQGQFSIESDDNCPWIKHVRVVTTVDYYLD